MPVRDDIKVRVLLLSRYDTNGASSRVRHYSYISLLREKDVEVTSQFLIDNDDIASFYSGRRRNWLGILRSYKARLSWLRRLEDFDIVWIEKEVFPALPAWTEHSLYSNRRIATVLDFDDLWIRRRERKGPSSILHSMELHKLTCACRAATFVTASNPYLATALEAETARRMIVQPNCIDVAIYARAAAAESARAPTERPRIGWIGTPYTANLYLPRIASVLNRLTQEKLTTTVLIGAGQSAPEITAKRVNWSIEREADDIAATDIGIQPLADDDFSRCKSGWKLYQFMAAGKPVVASRVGYAAELIDNGSTGYLVDSNEEFEHRLRQLTSNPRLREEMGRRAQSKIADQFSIEKGAEARAQLFRAALKQRRGSDA